MLDVALARFQHEQGLRQALTETRNERQEISSALKDRKLIDRANALLMKRQNLTEDAAYVGDSGGFRNVHCLKVVSVYRLKVQAQASAAQALQNQGRIGIRALR